MRTRYQALISQAQGRNLSNVPLARPGVMPGDAQSMQSNLASPAGYKVSCLVDPLINHGAACGPNELAPAPLSQGSSASSINPHINPSIFSAPLSSQGTPPSTSHPTLPSGLHITSSSPLKRPLREISSSDDKLEFGEHDLCVILVTLTD
ncbi:uncharacterized protein MELLADRAFT_59958 [Melampsora larici-populina 98AG31]|uniref:Uncharacterized protein n=1 Tax=Melampsora larici-populina (strain 98AG31 / pathotype 3-4-7) TaxID=747676 RepID=F4R9F4_MELLP|nr:uncharacterized protein MELLADRAFT_59958 [Melampsora larici-populina 98AG31]EGG10974.1 hypothetical protein MELLADRAFT_59958 [Melampsora larici-populina 98AG31]